MEILVAILIVVALILAATAAFVAINRQRKGVVLEPPPTERRGTTAVAEPETIDAPELADLMEQGAQLVDTRPTLMSRTRTLPGAMSAPPLPSSPEMPGIGSSAAPSSPPTSGEVVPPSAGAATLMNVNKASASDMVLVLGLTKDMADRVVSNRPYRVKGELVAKNVVPKETFDMIKDRITVSP